ncbi:MAG: hypothetical protein JSR84_07650 [Proteobacteria bacterium]|nr:hypothetical protein [Pseudomonadota bacterium]
MQVQRKIIDVHDTQVVIELPQSFVNRRVEVIALTMDDAPEAALARRQPSPVIARKGRTLGDLIAPIVDAGDWSDAP